MGEGGGEGIEEIRSRTVKKCRQNYLVFLLLFQANCLPHPSKQIFAAFIQKAANPVKTYSL